jgi:hypothetical protein
MTGPYEFKRWSGSDWWVLPKGYWTTTAAGTPPDWVVGSVFLACPLCGQVGGVPHAVDAAGRVTPSVVCPNTEKCPMHLAPVTLLGWDLGAKPSDR